MKKLLSLFIAVSMLFAFALAEIGTLEWEIRFWSERGMFNTELTALEIDDTDPDAVNVDLTYIYHFSGDDQTIASIIPDYCVNIIQHAQIYPECAQITFHWMPEADGPETVLVYSVTEYDYQLNETSGHLNIPVPER